jgi:hypothetical protein
MSERMTLQDAYAAVGLDLKRSVTRNADTGRETPVPRREPPPLIDVVERKFREIGIGSPLARGYAGAVVGDGQSGKVRRDDNGEIRFTVGGQAYSLDAGFMLYLRRDPEGRKIVEEEGLHIDFSTGKSSRAPAAGNAYAAALSRSRPLPSDTPPESDHERVARTRTDILDKMAAAHDARMADRAILFAFGGRR